MNMPRIAQWLEPRPDGAGGRGPVLFSGVLLAAAAVPASENLSIFDPVSPQAGEIRNFLYLVLAVTGAIFLLVEVLLIYCIFRFRRRSSDPPAEPPQIYGSKPVEIAWTVGPGIIVLVLFLVVVRVIGEIRKSQPPPGALPIRVIGHQWWWEYQYPEQGIVTANELHLPVGRPAFLYLESGDVIHSYWVPRLAGKTDVIPGKDPPNTMWFEPKETGVFLGQCAEYCGTQHAGMLLRVVVHSPEEFDAWVADQKKAAVEPEADSKAAKGRDLFLNLACMNCHTITGTPARGTVGPDLTHLASRQTLAAGVVENTPDKLFLWLKDPKTIKPGCRMPDMQLSDAQVQSLVDYLSTLR